MTAPDSASQTSVNDPLMFSPEVLADLQITSRALHKWIAQGKFAPPDTNIGGRNAWLTSTYRREKAAILAGRLKQVRRPFSESAGTPKARSA